MVLLLLEMHLFVREGECQHPYSHESWYHLPQPAAILPSEILALQHVSGMFNLQESKRHVKHSYISLLQADRAQCSEHSGG